MPNGPNDLLKEPLRESRPGRFVSSFRPFGRIGVALSPGQLAFFTSPQCFFRLPDSSFRSRFPVSATLVLSNKYSV